MKHPDLDFYIQQERRRDDLAAAADTRLVNEAMRAQTRQSGRRSWISLAVILSTVLAWLGSLFIGWSCKLQSRYASELRLKPCTET
jgi:hypothetical protein